LGWRLRHLVGATLAATRQCGIPPRLRRRRAPLARPACVPGTTALASSAFGVVSWLPVFAC